MIKQIRVVTVKWLTLSSHSVTIADHSLHHLFPGQPTFRPSFSAAGTAAARLANSHPIRHLSPIVNLIGVALVFIQYMCWCYREER